MFSVAQQNKTGSIKDFISKLILLHNHLRLYGSANKVVERATEQLCSALALLQPEESALTLFVGRHALIYQEQLIDPSNQIFAQFANLLFHQGISAVSFIRGVTAAEIHEFLRLVGRNPALSLEEGGITAVLRLRNVQAILVREMSARDFSLDAGEEEPRTASDSSPLWQRFAFSIVHGLQGGDAGSESEDFSPGVLAHVVNHILAEHNGSKDELLAKDLSRFVRSLKNDKSRIYRAATLSAMTEFVDALTPKVRDLFIHNIFNLDIDLDLTEELLSGVSDQVVLDALRNASARRNYAPPVVLQLLVRLATERGLSAPQPLVSAADSDAPPEWIGDLFHEDEFDKFVPRQYQKALFSIIQNRELPISVTENLTRLKSTLENQAIDRHVGEILLLILQGPRELQDQQLLSHNLKEVIDCYLASRDYAKIRNIVQLCRSEQFADSLAADIYEHIAASRFVATLLDDLCGLQQDETVASTELILEISAPFIAPLLDRLSVEDNRLRRRCYLNILARIGAECIPQAVSRLSDTRWFVVRNMLYLLREVGNPGVVASIRQCLHYPHPKVSQEALRICLYFKDKGAIRFLLTLLESNDESKLLQAVGYASLCDEPTVLKKMVVILRESSVINFRLELKKSIIRSLAAAVPHKVAPVFAGILASRNLLHPKAAEALKLEVIAALEKIPGAEAKRLLQEQSRSDSEQIRRAAQAALARSGGGAL